MHAYDSNSSVTFVVNDHSVYKMTQWTMTPHTDITSNTGRKSLGQGYGMANTS